MFRLGCRHQRYQRHQRHQRYWDQGTKGTKGTKGTREQKHISNTDILSRFWKEGSDVNFCFTDAGCLDLEVEGVAAVPGQKGRADVSKDTQHYCPATRICDTAAGRKGRGLKNTTALLPGHEYI